MPGLADPHAHGSPDGLGAVVVLAAVVVTLEVYAWLTWQRRREPRGWSGWRTASFSAGLMALWLGLTPGLLPWPGGSFGEHMAQHMLIGMYAPLGLALGAPVTLALRSLPRPQGRVLGRLLRTPAARVFAHPVTGLVLTVGGLAVLYLTSLYALSTRHGVIHHLVHAHFALSGYAFAHAMAGADPAPHRVSVPARLVILGVAVAGHAVLAQLIYAGVIVPAPMDPAQRRAGADLMYYAGDIAELLLALAMLTTWRPARRTGTAERRPAA